MGIPRAFSPIVTCIFEDKCIVREMYERKVKSSIFTGKTELSSNKSFNSETEM
jgi:hypothetical protein